MNFKEKNLYGGVKILFVALLCASLEACGGGGGGGSAPTSPPPPVQPPPPPPVATIDDRLDDIIADLGLSGDPSAGRNLPSINDPLAQLGKLLFFSKSLSGDFDTACASCHHPALGGGDGLSLPVGTGAINPDVVGPGRTRADELPNVGRHSQSVFNAGMLDAGMFFDSRVESIGKEAGLNGAGSGIRTPDSAFNVADPNAGTTLPAAQALFPVTEATEMRGSLMPGADGDAVREHLAARIGDYGSGAGEIANNNWLAEFQTAFASALPANQLITYENIALAIAEYQRSMVFVDTPWKAYVEGDRNAISQLAKEGALFFFRSVDEGGADCAACHSGDFFTDELHHTLAFPQIGPGKGNGPSGDDDFGRENQSGVAAERYRFRTPTLLNLGVTAPYAHSGVYETIDFVVNHYAVPDIIFNDFTAGGGVCSLAQFAQNADCATLFPNMAAQFGDALAKVMDERISDPTRTFPDIRHLPQSEFPKLRAFLATLDDPCASDRACIAPWIPDAAEAPDGNQLNATDAGGNPL